MTVVAMEGVGACCLVCRSLTRHVDMDSQLEVGEESILFQRAAPTVVEVMLTPEQERRSHKELELGLGMGLDSVRNMGVTDPHVAPLPVGPSSTETNTINSIKV